VPLLPCQILDQKNLPERLTSRPRNLTAAGFEPHAEVQGALANTADTPRIPAEAVGCQTYTGRKTLRGCLS